MFVGNASLTIKSVNKCMLLLASLERSFNYLVLLLFTVYTVVIVQ